MHDCEIAFLQHCSLWEFSSRKLILDSEVVAALPTRSAEQLDGISFVNWIRLWYSVKKANLKTINGRGGTWIVQLLFSHVGRYSCCMGWCCALTCQRSSSECYGWYCCWSSRTSWTQRIRSRCSSSHCWSWAKHVSKGLHHFSRYHFSQLKLSGHQVCQLCAMMLSQRNIRFGIFEARTQIPTACPSWIWEITGIQAYTLITEEH